MIINPKSGVAFKLHKGQRLKIVDPKGEQVSDFFCVNQANYSEQYSTGRTIDYLSKIYVGVNDLMYSNLSKPMLKILEDTVGRHDILLTPCSKDTFSLIYGDKHPHQGCEGNLSNALSEFDVDITGYPSTFNVFMNVDLDKDGNIKVLAPKSKPGDYIILEAMMDLIVGLTACSALQSNNGSFKPIEYEVL